MSAFALTQTNQHTCKRDALAHTHTHSSLYVYTQMNRSEKLDAMYPFLLPKYGIYVVRRAQERKGPKIYG